MDLRTRYLGLELEHPIMVGASPLVDELDTVRRLEDAGAAALVMHSLFEEQIAGERAAVHAFVNHHVESSPEARTYLPEPAGFRLGPDRYLDQLLAIKRAVAIPVVASLNGTTLGYWLEAARLLEQAGADALELNVYRLATDPQRNADELEFETVEMVRAVRREVALPIAVKLSPFYTSLPHLAERLAAAGADALVLFNRFYQPDFDLEQLEVERTLRLSDSSELLLRLRWLAILRGRVPVGLAASGGVHRATDVIKALMAGADVAQVVSLLLLEGPDALVRLRSGLVQWLEEHGYDGLTGLRGCLSLARCPDPSAFERANYVQLLQSWRALV
jgi:dihydroorotate dehydrogenase (fumarate)